MASRYLNARPATDIFTDDANIDRRKCRRTVPLKVLVLGLGRTGTTSIRLALKQLGYEDTYHMTSASVENSLDCLMWQMAFEAKFEGKGKFEREDWDQLLGHCQAVCDWPASIFGKELIKAYPDAKVILTNRDVNAWHSSSMKTVWWRVNDPELRMLSYVDWSAKLYYPMLRKMFDTYFHGDFPNVGKSVYMSHYSEIRGLIPPERLLDYEVSEGWDPLCKFLGKEEPYEVPFPHQNDIGHFIRRCRKRNRKLMMNVLFRYAVYGVVVGFLWYAVRLL